ncbi:MAG: GAF domain-containing protein [Bradyrhizobium sp.]|nr:GAF domain-containing protein [Bradyrhizobium sp.]
MGGKKTKAKARKAIPAKSRKAAKTKRGVAIKRRKGRSVEAQLTLKTRELREALAQQTATAEVLQVISTTSGDLTLVFDTMLEKAMHLCGAEFGVLGTYDGKTFRTAATRGLPDKYAAHRARSTGDYGPGTAPFRHLQGEPLVHIVDLMDSEAYRAGEPNRRALVDLGGARCLLCVPLLSDGRVIGCVMIFRQQPRPFNDRQIALLKYFAAQAVIAIENARLFNETQEVLERQTATADILKVIASSPSDAQPVFEAIAERSKRLIGARSTAVYSIVDDVMHLMAFTRISPEADAALQASFPRPLSDADWADRIRHGEVVEIADAQAEFATNPVLLAMVRLRGFRSQLFVPLLHDGTTIGVISVARADAGAFAPHYVHLLQTFADQAVIAIENVRLFDEVQARTRDLTESLQQQTATADILRIISRSVAHAAPVFDTILESCQRLFNPYDAAVYLVEGDRVRGVAQRGAAAGEWGADLMPLEGSSTGVAIAQRRPIHFPDLADKPDLPEDKKALVKETGGMTVLYAPMISHDSGVGSLVVTRRPKKPFTEAEIGLIQTFADQAVIAIENARLFNEVQQRTRELSQSLDDLRTAQDRLVQTEKLASLGQLTAGIAHEIKNPLNFVNNFSALSSELVDEMTEVFENPALDEVGRRKELDEIRGLLKSNLEKVVQHGKRADAIVKNMLLHSREGSGERQPAEVNKLVEESLNLAYHGARAEDAGFTITLKHDLDPEAGALDLYPQEMTRALLNLISNGFYAATKRKVEAGDGAFEPVLSAATRSLGKAVEIRIRDNGTGIPQEVREKIFNPFFTTKPTGEGTGLGLSMTYDIVVKQHGGQIDVETEPGAFTEFIITLPRGNGSGLKSE